MSDRKTITTKGKILVVEPPSEKFKRYSLHVELSEPVEGFGKDGPVKVLADTETWTIDDLVRGVEHEIAFEHIPAKEGKGETNYLVSWNGKERAQWSGGRGSKGYKPRTPEEIHAPSIAGIIKSVIEGCIAKDVAEKSTIDTYLAISFDSYWDQMKKASSASSKSSEGEAS
ncbi:MAG: hypothetical protein JST51_01615 [Armatimonadetes bacterium]|nr:hypothetical protein [Armatimonadota bacterium]